MKENNKGKENVNKYAHIFAIPLLFFIVLYSICLGFGRQLISNLDGFDAFLVSFTTVTLTTIALSTNLNSGRFDFSLGSMAVLSTILSGKTIYPLLQGGSGTAILILLFSVLYGAILGLFSGGIYVLLRIPPIITSLAVTLIFEGISFTITNGSYMMEEVRGDSMSFFMKQWWAILLILVIVMGITIYLFNYTSFGNHYKCLKNGQKISVSQGIREVPNALACYAFCGAIMGVVGFLQAGLTTSVNGGSLNFASISIMFTAFLPMFIGGYIGRYSNDYIGYLLAGLSMAMLNSFFSVLHNEIDASVQSIINAVLLVLFLIFLANEKKIVAFFHRLGHRKEEKKA